MPAGAVPVAGAAPTVVSASVTRSLLADDLDPVTGELQAITTAPHPVEAAVREAFRIQRASGPAVEAVGQNFRSVKKQDEHTGRSLYYEAERIMAPFVARKEAQVLGIDVDPEQAYAQAGVRVRWVNLLTGTTVTTAVQ